MLLLLLVEFRHKCLFLTNQKIRLIGCIIFVVKMLQRLTGQSQINVQWIATVFPGVCQYGQTAICFNYSTTLIV